MYALRDAHGYTHGIFATRQQAETWRLAMRDGDGLRIEVIGDEGACGL